MTDIDILKSSLVTLMIKYPGLVDEVLADDTATMQAFKMAIGILLSISKEGCRYSLDRLESKYPGLKAEMDKNTALKGLILGVPTLKDLAQKEGSEEL